MQYLQLITLLKHTRVIKLYYFLNIKKKKIGIRKLFLIKNYEDEYTHLYIYDRRELFKDDLRRKWPVRLSGKYVHVNRSYQMVSHVAIARTSF